MSFKKNSLTGLAPPFPPTKTFLLLKKVKNEELIMTENLVLEV